MYQSMALARPVGCRSPHSIPKSSPKFHPWKDESVQKWWTARAGWCTRERHRCTFARSTLSRSIHLATRSRFVILKFSYPNFGMDPTTPPPDVGRHGYLSFRGCTSACWSPARATTGRRRSPSPTRGRWCNQRSPSCICRPLSSRCPVHRLQGQIVSPLGKLFSYMN